MSNSLSKKIFDVWHQYPPVRCVGREVRFGEEVRVYEPAVIHIGQVEAIGFGEAIQEAIRTRLSPWPLVRVV